MGIAASFARLYPSADSLRAFADECMSKPAVVAMLGPVYAPTVGGLTAWRTGAMGMLAAAIPSLLIVIRHTRAEEEAGQREILGATVVGRHAARSAALIVTTVANLLLAAVAAGGLMSLGLPAPGVDRAGTIVGRLRPYVRRRRGDGSANGRQHRHRQKHRARSVRTVLSDPGRRKFAR